jgi:hypothetical protein
MMAGSGDIPLNAGGGPWIGKGGGAGIPAPIGMHADLDSVDTLP